LNVIPHFLRSPAKSFITARGVESVSSPVANVSLNNDAFMFAVQEHFAKQYGASSISAVEIGDTWLEDENVRKGYDELKVRQITPYH
jgi:lipoate-protein ligase A